MKTWLGEHPRLLFHFTPTALLLNLVQLSVAISESATSSRVCRLAHRYRFLGGIQVTAPLAFVCCRAHAQRVIPRRTPARPESIRAGDAPCRRIKPFRRSHIFAVGAA